MPSLESFWQEDTSLSPDEITDKPLNVFEKYLPTNSTRVTSDAVAGVTVKIDADITEVGNTGLYPPRQLAYTQLRFTLAWKFLALASLIKVSTSSQSTVFDHGYPRAPACYSGLCVCHHIHKSPRGRTTPNFGKEFVARVRGPRNVYHRLWRLSETQIQQFAQGVRWAHADEMPPGSSDDSVEPLNFLDISHRSRIEMAFGVVGDLANSFDIPETRDVDKNTYDEANSDNVDTDDDEGTDNEESSDDEDDSDLW
ncbi:hypothetical protein F5Y16DRAFT_417383 [Xylariaceae sp. FL0255]|nr:hypothetical protein F5Y16DRAFT_417383 [Xylariaceae sp. FL0255]